MSGMMSLVSSNTVRDRTREGKSALRVELAVDAKGVRVARVSLHLLYHDGTRGLPSFTGTQTAR